MDNLEEKWVDVAKGMGILLVVLGHVIGLPLPIRKYIYSFHMPLFFFISGYLYNANKYKLVALNDYIKNRWTRLINPYLAMALTCYCLFVIVPFLKNHIIDISSYAKPLIGIVYSRGSAEWMPNCSPLWFLTCLFLTQIIFFIICKNSTNLKIFICCVLCTVVGFLIYVSISFKLPWNFDTALIAVFLYSLGYFARTYNALDIVKKNAVKIIPLMLVIGIITSHLNGTVDMDSNMYGNIFLFYTGAISSIVVVIYTAGIFSKLNILSFWGKNTMPVIGFNYAVITLTAYTGEYAWYISFFINLIIIWIMILFMGRVNILHKLFYGYDFKKEKKAT